LLIKTWEVNLPLPETDFYLDWRYGRLDVLVLAGDRPLAIVQLYPPAESRVIPAAQIHREVARKLGWYAWENTCLGQSWYVNGDAESAAALPPISVVVCTRDRPVSLEVCLESLARLDYPDYEVVVVDNASRGQAVRDVILRSGFRYVREERAGLDWARNRGAAEARHDLIAYLDDDACASPGWLRAISRAFTDPSVSAVTGLVLPAELETEPQMLFEEYGGMSKGIHPRIFDGRALDPHSMLSPHNCGVGANMAFRREVLRRMDWFDTALDVGTPSSGGGDLDIFHRIMAAGLMLRYEPSAWARHRHRRDIEGLDRQIYNNGRSFGVLLLKIWKSRSVPRKAVLAYARGWITGWLLSRLVQRVRRKIEFPLGLIWAEISGALSAPWAWRATLRSDRKLRASPAAGAE